MLNEISYNELGQYLKDHVRGYLPEEYANASIDIIEVRKNNMVKHGFSIKKEDDSFSPVIYLEDIHESYGDLSGQKFTQKVAEIYMDNKDLGFDLENLKGSLGSFETVKDHIFPKVIAIKGNEEYLKNLPHETFQDMAVLYYIDLDITMGLKKATVTITDEILAIYEKTISDLHEIAVTNMAEKKELVIEPLQDVVAEIQGVPKEMLGFPDDGPKQYVVNTADRYNSAALIINPDVLDKVAEKVGGSYYVLPSSIHEIIAIPENDLDFGLTEEDLRGLVIDANIEAVTPTDRLTNSIYYYDAKTKEFAIVEPDKEQSLD